MARAKTSATGRTRGKSTGKASSKSASTGAKAATRKNVKYDKSGDAVMHFCGLKEEPPRVFGQSVGPARMEAIIVSDKKWVNGTKLRYYFFDRASDGETVRFTNGTTAFVPWKGRAADVNQVRKAFKTWKDLGLGLEFEEVSNREDAEIRIGFMQGDGSWSYLGRDILSHGPHKRTMNFGWPLGGADGFDTALHEIGHTLGLPHEHQNPNAGIIWNEDEVYRRLAMPPNNWSRDKTFFNIIRKIPSSTVQGTEWDRDSVMHYPFGAGMISVPEEFREQPLRPAGGLSPRDKAWVRETYPPLSPTSNYPELKVFRSHTLALGAGEQFDGVFRPPWTWKYTIETFGSTDMVLTLFEETPDGPQFLAGDDDSGQDWNAKITLRLIKGRSYLIRTRLFYSWTGGESAIMIH